MKKKIFIILNSLLLSCGSNPQKPLEVSSIEATSGEMILQGSINMTNLQNSTLTPWFNEEYNSISVDPLWVKELNPYLKGLKIKIFMGTWCEDSQREIPHFFKLLNALELDHKQVEMYAMSEEKTTPQNFEKGLKVHNVPTLIFFKNGNEMNRFVEFPLKTLETDIAKIIKGEAYTHSYE